MTKDYIFDALKILPNQPFYIRNHTCIYRINDNLEVQQASTEDDEWMSSSFDLSGLLSGFFEIVTLSKCDNTILFVFSRCGFSYVGFLNNKAYFYDENLENRIEVYMPFDFYGGFVKNGNIYNIAILKNLYERE